MKSKLCKSLTMIITLVLMLTIIPVSSFAAEPSDTVYNGVDYALVYNYDFYMGYADLKAAYGTRNDKAGAIKHFVTYGMKEGRQASANFNVLVYKANYTDLQEAFGESLVKYYKHYINYGYKEGRNAVSLISSENSGETTTPTPMSTPNPETKTTTTSNSTTAKTGGTVFTCELSVNSVQGPKTTNTPSIVTIKVDRNATSKITFFGNLYFDAGISSVFYNVTHKQTEAIVPITNKMAVSGNKTVKTGCHFLVEDIPVKTLSNGEYHINIYAKDSNKKQYTVGIITVIVYGEKRIDPVPEVFETFPEYCKAHPNEELNVALKNYLKSHGASSKALASLDAITKKNVEDAKKKRKSELVQNNLGWMSDLAGRLGQDTLSKGFKGAAAGFDLFMLINETDPYSAMNYFLDFSTLATSGLSIEGQFVAADAECLKKIIKMCKRAALKDEVGTIKPEAGYLNAKTYVDRLLYLLNEYGKTSDEYRKGACAYLMEACINELMKGNMEIPYMK